MPSSTHDAAVAALVNLFPTADPVFLAHAVQHYLDSSDCSSHVQRSTAARRAPSATDAVTRVVSQVVHKMVEMNFDEYPRVVRRLSEVDESEDDGGPREASDRARTKRSRSSQYMKSAAEQLGGSTGGRRRAQEPPVDEVMTRNIALIRLHDVFPLVPISDLRHIVASNEHAVLHRSVEQILRSSTARTRRVENNSSNLAAWLAKLWTGQDFIAATSSTVPMLRPQDLFRSKSYKTELVKHLKSTYPSVPTSTIRSFIAEDCQSYEELRTELETWSNSSSGFKKAFLRWFERPHQPEAVRDRDLRQEIWEFEARERLALSAKDEREARRLNKEWTAESDLYECGCCFDDELTFEDVVCCRSGQHFFCRSCVRRQVSQLVVGDARFENGYNVQCMSTRGCHATFARDELDRTLDRDLLKRLDQRIAQAELENIETSGTATVLRCPFCSYAELSEERSPWRTLFVRTTPVDWVDWLVLGLCAVQSVGVLLLIVLPVVLTGLLIAPDRLLQRTSTNDGCSRLFPLLEPWRAASVGARFTTDALRQALAIKYGSNNVFKCRNTPTFGQTCRASFPDWLRPPKSFSQLVRVALPDQASISEQHCGKTSCRTCHKQIDMRMGSGAHKCWQDETDSLRLAVERARTQAVKRTCPKCGLAFVKESGCNKMSLNPICTECDRCHLWKAEDEQAVADRAARRARDEWIRDHPEANQSAVSQFQASHTELLQQTDHVFDTVCRSVAAALSWIV
ncbi:hypothetical protein ACM66B_003480 [Microbotryomycetes sp. NB124-2]